MRDNSYDRTIERNYLQKWRFLIPEYEAVKAGRSTCSSGLGISTGTTEPARRRSASITTAICRAGTRRDLLPRRRGPKWRERREPEGIEAEIVAHRKRG